MPLGSAKFAFYIARFAMFRFSLLQISPFPLFHLLLQNVWDVRLPGICDAIQFVFKMIRPDVTFDFS